MDVYEDSITTDAIRNIVPTTEDVIAHALTAGQSYLDADFGYFVGALVQGNVFWDTDRSGVFETIEMGLSPVTVTLTGTDMFGNTITKTVDTDSDGHFVFIVPEGDYTLTYDMADVTAINPALTDTTTPTSFTFHATPGEDWHPVFDFGVDNSGSLGDRVWNDTNGNGIQDTGEIGIGNVTLYLCLTTPCDAASSLATTTTDPTGMYKFSGLGDGTFYVSVNPATLPAGYTPTGEGDPGTACTRSCDN